MQREGFATSYLTNNYIITHQLVCYLNVCSKVKKVTALTVLKTFACGYYIVKQLYNIK